MEEDNHKHVTKLPIGAIPGTVTANPQVPCTPSELNTVLMDMHRAVDNEDYISPTPTVDNPSLSDDYIFDTEDQNMILKDLSMVNFVGKIKDLGKGAIKRIQQGFPQEYLYVFQYPCKLMRRDAQSSGCIADDVLIYIKINDRQIPYKKVIIISFHKNRTV